MAIRACLRILNRTLLTVVIVAGLGSSLAWCQTDIALPSASNRSASVTNVRRHIAIVFLAGIGGAVLGLSTLSFYSDPPNHVSNISAGLMVGLLGGAGYIITEAYQSPRMDSGLGLDPMKDLQAKVQPTKVYGPQWAWTF